MSARKKAQKILDTNNNKKINNFFKSAPKTSSEDTQPSIADKQNKISAGSSKQFYVDVLKKKIQSSITAIESGVREIEANIPIEEVASAHPCAKATLNDRQFDAVEPADSSQKCMTADCQQLREKYKLLQKKYAKLAIEHSELNMKYNDQRKTVEKFYIEGQTTSDGLLLDSEVQALHRISMAKKNDSTFVRACLEYLYQDDITILRNKSTMGTAETTRTKRDGSTVHYPAKMPLTPKKISKIKELFVQRLAVCQLDPVTYGERINDSRINQLIATGIKNIAKK